MSVCNNCDGHTYDREHIYIDLNVVLYVILRYVQFVLTNLVDFIHMIYLKILHGFALIDVY